MKYSTSLVLVALLALCHTTLSSVVYVDNVAASYKLGQASDSSICAFLGTRAVSESFVLDNQNSFPDSKEVQYLEFNILDRSFAAKAEFTVLASVAAGDYQIWQLSSLPKNCSDVFTSELVGNYTELASSGAYAIPPTNVRSWVKWDLTRFYNRQLCNGATSFVLGFSGLSHGSAIYMPMALTSAHIVRRPSIEGIINY